MKNEEEDIEYWVMTYGGMQLSLLYRNQKRGGGTVSSNKKKQTRAAKTRKETLWCCSHFTRQPKDTVSFFVIPHVAYVRVL